MPASEETINPEKAPRTRIPIRKRLHNEEYENATAGIVAKKADTTMEHHETWNTSGLGHLGPEQPAGKT